MAAYLLNFGKFVKWPASSEARGASFDICVLGRDPFGASLGDAVEGETIGGAPIAARRLRNLEEAKGCRILFVSASEEPDLKRLLAMAGREHMLTVSNIPHFADRRGMIGFVLRDRRVRFQVNLDAIEESGMTVSSELLRVADAIARKGTAR